MVVFVSHFLHPLSSSRPCFASYNSTINKNSAPSAFMTIALKKHWKSLVLLLALTASSWSGMFAAQRPTRQLRGDEPSRRIVTIGQSEAVSTAAEPIPDLASQCNEASTSMSKWTFTSLRAAEDYPKYHDLSDFLEGPSLSDQNVETAVCEFRRVKYWHHFPHAYVKIWQVCSVGMNPLPKQVTPIILSHRLSSLLLVCSSSIAAGLGGWRILISNPYSFFGTISIPCKIHFCGAILKYCTTPSD